MQACKILYALSLRVVNCRNPNCHRGVLQLAQMFCECGSFRQRFSAFWPSRRHGAAAVADTCPQPGSEIATDRPDVTNSSLVVPKGSFQQENGVNIAGRDGGQVFDGTNTRLRLGIAECLEVLVDVPTYFDALSGRASTGFTNVTPAVKWQISPLPGKIDLSATFGAGLPTGTKAVAGPGVQPYVQFPWSWELAAAGD